MNKIEDIFKKSLENAEAPYDAKAWDSMASRLDQVMPVAQPKGSFKWAWIAGVVLVAGSTALYFANQNTELNQNTEIAQNQAEKSTQELSKSKEVISSNSVKVENETISNEVIKVDDVITVDKRQQPKVTVPENNMKSINAPEKVALTTVQQPNQQSPAEKNKQAETVKATRETKAVTGDEKISIENVYAKIDFSASNQTFYEKGLPFNSLICNVEAKKYKWTNERGEILSTDKDADIHLFTAGTHLITLTIEHSNGEKQSVTKPVRCEINYNLLAVTGFNPTSSDYRNNTFIPFALLKSERNISFDMQIIDPKSGQVVFETKSADNPWDGIDVRTNQMVPVNSTYIWRVNIHEKAVGEPTNRYQGTITRI